jgi:hypothetical protein
MNQLFVSIYQLLQSGQDCTTSLNKLEEAKLTPKEMKSFISLKLRHLIQKGFILQVDEIISTTKLMKRDYWLCVEYYYIRDKIKAREIMRQYIDCIDTNDIDIMISNGWNDLIREWDGTPVVATIESNTSDISKLTRYNFDISSMISIYRKKLSNKYCTIFEKQIENYDVLIDGANISHIGKDFRFNELVKVIQLIERMGLKPCVIIHERHIIKNTFLLRYIVRTPKNNYDDNFLLYGMFRYNKMVVSNDLFRDHVIDLDSSIKCFIDMMTIKYIEGTLHIPQYSKCIQVVDDSIYIPCTGGMYKL